jgi:Domain of unknown function (DUF4403)
LSRAQPVSARARPQTLVPSSTEISRPPTSSCWPHRLAASDPFLDSLNSRSLRIDAVKAEIDALVSDASWLKNGFKGNGKMVIFLQRKCCHVSRGALVLLCTAYFSGIAIAGEKPPLIPDLPSALSTASRISAVIEFGLPSIASAIERDVPKRLATIDERIGCVNRRVFLFRIRANCDVAGFVDRGGISLYGRGDHIVGSCPIFGVVEGQGANRFTSRIHGDAEGRATIEVESRPKMSKDWSIDLQFSDAFHWTEPPILHILGREISLTRYAEPSVRKQLARLRAQARDAARRLDLRDKAAKAWQQAFQPVQISQDPAIWLQITPSSVAFAGIRADSKDLSGSLELTGKVETLIGQPASEAKPTPLPPLENDLSQPGAFEVLLPVRVNYGFLRDKIMQVVATSDAGAIVKEMQIYPSSGRLVIGVRVAKPSDKDPAAGEWLYLSAVLTIDADQHSIKISNLTADSSVQDGTEAAQLQTQLLDLFKQIPDIGYGLAYQNLVSAANERLNRPLKDGFRMEGRLATAKLDSIQLLADDISIAFRVSGNLKLVYGM